jgi:hypothetical protein
MRNLLTLIQEYQALSTQMVVVAFFADLTGGQDCPVAYALEYDRKVRTLRVTSRMQSSVNTPTHFSLFGLANCCHIP